MKQSYKKAICAALTFSLLLAPMQSAWAVSGEVPAAVGIENESDMSGSLELYNALTPEVSRIEATAGYLHNDFSSTILAYEMTLGPDEPGFSLVATPVETEFPPTMELFLDGGEEAFDTLQGGVPSRLIEVEQRQTRTVKLRSSSYTDGRVREYIFTVHRTPTQFAWRLGETATLADGGTLLPVTLTAPAGLEMKQLAFSLGFDPAVLQLATPAGEVATDALQCIATADGFEYEYDPDSKTSKGYFAPLTDVKGADFLTVDYGAKSTSSTKPPYLVEVGKETLLTVYFRLSGQLEPDSLFVRESEQSPKTGIGVTERINGADVHSTCNGMARVEGLPARTYTVTLPKGDFLGGTVAVNPERTVFQEGERLELTASANIGYAFAGWDNLPPGVTANGAQAAVTVKQNLDLSGLTARFTQSSLLPSTAGVDTEAPYEGEYLLAVGSGTARAQMSVEEAGSSVLGEDKNGLTRLEYHEGLEVEGAALRTLSTAPEYQVGDKAIFKTRNMTNSSEKWVDKSFTLKAVSSGINLWFEDDNLMQITEQQFSAMLVSCQRSVNVMAQKFGTIYDRNGNGKLDVLLYDIRDSYSLGGASSYYAGLVNAEELYLKAGNQMDTVHLDTYPAMGTNYTQPNVSTVVSTMAHETQHLVMFSAFEEEMTGAGSGVPLIERLPPTWVNEGLSMAVEHELFGTLFSRIATFNNAVGIRDGTYSLTNWKGVVENYALAYLFMEYLNSQADMDGVSGFLKQFYTDYSGGSDQVLHTIIQSIPNLNGLTFDETVACWYAAMLLQQDSGVYGYGGSREFRAVAPRSAQSIPENLSSAAAVYVSRSGAYSPDPGSANIYLGLTPGGREPAPEPVELKGVLGAEAAVNESGTQAVVTSEGGTVTLSRTDGTALRRLFAGDSILLKATPAAGMRFAGWRVVATTTDPLQSGSVAGDPTLIMENPWTTTAQTGVEITALYEAKATSEKPPLLGSMEVIGNEGRQLSDGNGDFGFKKEVLDYELWLLPGETGLSLALRSEDNVAKLTVKGKGAAVELTPEANQNGGITWKAGMEYPVLDLEKDTTQGTVLLTLSDAYGVESVYTVQLRRAVGRPETLISQTGNEVVANVNGAQLYTVSLALEIPAATFSGTPGADGRIDVSDRLSTLPVGLVYSKAVVEETDGGQLLRVTIDTKVPSVHTQPFSIPLFEGALSGVSILPMGNSISDARFGGLDDTTRIEGTARIKGNLIAFDPKSEVTVQVWTGEGFETKESETGAVKAAATGSGRYEASFFVTVPQNTACKLVFQKKGHVPFTVILESGTGMTISETLYLACGELNGDGRIDFQDKFCLTGLGYGGERNPSDPYPRDLNGDGSVDARDLNLLTGQKHYGANEQSQCLDLRGGQGV